MSRPYSTLVVAVLVCAAGVQAGNFPERAVNLVVPFAVGGSTDVLARVLSLRLAEQWGQQVVVNNVAGDSSISVRRPSLWRRRTAIRCSSRTPR